MEQLNEFDITIIGGGHAGLEAACISAQFGLKVCIITLPGVPIASAPCNPAIGGVGKGQVVREIDALGGVMGKLADRSAIQYRTLNDSKGYAVRSTRVQVDKIVYANAAEEYVAAIENITIIRKRVDKIDSVEGGFKLNGVQVFTKKLIITAGTFLNGVLHTGEESKVGGRVGCESSKGLEHLLSKMKRKKIRFKTGTPPRLLNSSLDYAKMREQESDPQTSNFHLLHKPFKRFLPQVSCFITDTNKKTLDIIRKNKSRSPIFNGQISGIGPRYCPSIEDKAFRYPERHNHHVFCEPEGLNIDTIYPNGISTSLPKDVQEDFIRSIPGLEQAKIEIYGYAVEYDVVDTKLLNLGLESKDLSGLYFAGQINGTSGYEEAAGQGLIAGINAAFSVLNRGKFILDRNDSYIGVMIEDLVTNTRDEPYRLFTARSENRLYIREDNVVERMRPYRTSLGLKTKLDEYLEMFHVEHLILSELCEAKNYYPNKITQERFKKNGYSPITNNKMSLNELLQQGHVDPIKVIETECRYHELKFNHLVEKTIAISSKYSGYIKRSDIENSRTQKLDSMKLDLDEILKSKNISYECKQRIREINPINFGQLRKIKGMRPSSLTAIANQIH